MKRVENEFAIKVSYADIYNETLIDLLRSPSSDGKEDKASEEVCSNIDQILSLIRMGDINRQIGATRLNERLQKAHTLLQLSVESSFFREESNRVVVSTITFVECAGAELLLNYDEASMSNDRSVKSSL